MNCKNCAYPKVLCFAIYCKKDPELRDLPASQGDLFGPPHLQSTAPEWCPLAGLTAPQLSPAPCA